MWGFDTPWKFNGSLGWTSLHLAYPFQSRRRRQNLQFRSHHSHLQLREDAGWHRHSWLCTTAFWVDLRHQKRLDAVEMMRWHQSPSREKECSKSSGASVLSSIKVKLQTEPLLKTWGLVKHRFQIKLKRWRTQWLQWVTWWYPQRPRSSAATRTHFLLVPKKKTSCPENIPS